MTPLRRPEHEPEFYTSSARGNFVACRCGWEMPVPDVTVSAYAADLAHSFFRAGFSAGQAYERHVRVAEVR